ncbi:MAG: bacillithiol biosynthesis cysteine-adding enzyme BshC [Planctomycetes bacterium]|nr:bacillithiol biosynthesis cysteine-adding enzyme BshC [Planctomycetota bacterium]
MVTDWTTDFSKVRPFFRRDPRSAADWAALFQELAAHEYPRYALAEALVRATDDAKAPPAAKDNASRFLEKNTFAVITGQQAGLFGGPLFNLYKALTAVKLAGELQKRHPEFRFVPVFWVASDDHDLGEIDHAYFLEPGGATRRLKVEIGAEARGCSAVDVTVRDSIAALAQPLEELLPGAAQALLEPYRAKNLGAAYAQLLSQWLGHLGLIVVESYEIRRLGKKLYQRELNEYPKTCALIREAGQRLKAAGYAAEFDEAKDAPHLFASSNAIRAKLEPADAEGTRFVERSPAFAARSQEPDTFEKNVLILTAETQPEAFSASAALRPVLQQLAFPVAAAVLGPGEINYWVQLPELHDHYGAVWPMVVPRASFTLLDAIAEKAVRKLDLKPADLFLPDADLKALALGGSSAECALNSGRERVLAEFDRMFEKIRESDKGLDPLFTKARERIAHELERIAEKTRASAAQKDGAGLARLERLVAFLRPGGKPQERTLCGAQFLAQHPGLVEALLEALDPFAFEHRVLGLSS